MRVCVLLSLLSLLSGVAVLSSAMEIQSSCLVNTESACEFSSCQNKLNMSCVQAQPYIAKKGGEIQVVSKGHANDSVNITETMMLVILRKNDTMIGSTVGPSCEPFVSEFPTHNKDVVLIESSGLPCIMSPGDPVDLNTSVYMPDGEGEYELNVAVFTLHHSIACIAARIVII